jgi:hypothetical protein
LLVVQPINLSLPITAVDLGCFQGFPLICPTKSVCYIVETVTK